MVGVDKRFEPKEGFRLIITVKNDTVPDYFKDGKCDVIKVSVPQNVQSGE